MHTLSSVPTVSSNDIQNEMNHMRRDILVIFLLPISLLPFVWILHISYDSYHLSYVDLAIIQLIIISFLVFKIREKHLSIACWAFTISMIIAFLLFLVSYPDAFIMIYFSVIILIANALLGPLYTFLVYLFIFSFSSIIIHSITGIAFSNQFLGIFILYFLMWGIASLSFHPIRTSVQWTLAGWEHAHRLLQETRERRAEVTSALHALDEATYRIHRMNNELISARDEAERLRHLKARFVAMVSHELRGPLNLILGFSRLIALSPERYSVPLPAAYRADVATVFRNSQHLATLIDDVLDLAQIESERLPLIKDRIDLERDVIKEAMDIVRPLAERKGLVLQDALASDLPLVLADRFRLRQVMLNILTNAVRYTKQGFVRVTTQKRNGDILISVQDTGPGIADEEIPSLFQAFSHIQTVEEGEQQGSGLGLSISKHLVELHDGRIWVDSQVGTGTTFFFTVPLPNEDPVAGRMVRTERAKTHSNALQHDIIVYADPSIVRLLARQLKGCNIVGVVHEAELLTLVDELHPRAVIVASDLAQGIYENLCALGLDVPVISCGIPEPRDQFQDILGYLIKPVAPDAVRAMMSDLVHGEDAVVLLVDDDPDAVRLIESMLTALPYPYHILKAYDGLQAWSIMEHTVPDVVFLDLIMPGLSGEELLARMREQDDLCDVPVVVVSARDWTEDAVTLGLPFILRRQRSVPLGQIIRCLQAMVDDITPHYPTRTAPPGVRGAEPPL